MNKWTKKNWLPLIAIILSVVTTCVVSVRIEPINFNNGSMVSFTVGLIGVCATIMVGIQIYSIIYSEEKIKRKIEEEGRRIKYKFESDMIRSLFRTEIVVANLLIADKNWDEFVGEIVLLTEYVMYLKDEQRANDLSKMILKTDDRYQFYNILSSDSKKKLENQILQLCKLANNPKELLNRFT